MFEQNETNKTKKSEKSYSFEYTPNGWMASLEPDSEEEMPELILDAVKKKDDRRTDVEKPESESAQKPEPKPEAKPDLEFDSSTEKNPEAEPEVHTDGFEVLEDNDSEEEDDEPLFENHVGLITLIRSVRTYFYRRAQMRKRSDEEEPDYRETASKCSDKARRLKLREGLALFVCVLSAYISFGAQNSKMLLPLFAAHAQMPSLTVLILMMCTMLICLEQFMGGMRALFSLDMGADALVSLSCLAAAVDAAVCVVRDRGMGFMPYCTAAGFALLFMLHGERMKLRAYRYSLRVACISKEPMVLSSEQELMDEPVLVKKTRKPSGFYNGLVAENAAETAYSYAAPVLALMSLVFSAICAAHGNYGVGFFHCLSAMLCVSASFLALTAYSLPLYKTSRRLAAKGSAVAGWDGACSIAGARSVVACDSDIFPMKTLKLGSVRITGRYEAWFVISATASILERADSMLRGLLDEQLKKSGGVRLNVKEFELLEGGGVGGLIDGSEVLVGSSGFMALMGVSVPAEFDTKYGIFCAIDDELCGVFSVEYRPLNSVMNAMNYLLHSRITPYLAVRDFNINPLMLKNKFGIAPESVNYPTVEKRFRFSSKELKTKGAAAAVLTRDGLGVYADIIAGGRGLHRSVVINTVLSLISSFAGLLLMYYVWFAGDPTAASAWNTLLYLLLWTLPGAIVAWAELLRV